MRRTGGVVIVLLGAAVSLAYGADKDKPPSPTDQDPRLTKPRDLNTYAPFTPPATREACLDRPLGSARLFRGRLGLAGDDVARPDEPERDEQDRADGDRPPVPDHEAHEPDRETDREAERPKARRRPVRRPRRAPRLDH